MMLPPSQPAADSLMRLPWCGPCRIPQLIFVCYCCVRLRFIIPSSECTEATPYTPRVADHRFKVGIRNFWVYGAQNYHYHNLMYRVVIFKCANFVTIFGSVSVAIKTLNGFHLIWLTIIFTLMAVLSFYLNNKIRYAQNMKVLRFIGKSHDIFTKSTVFSMFSRKN